VQWIDEFGSVGGLVGLARWMMFCVFGGLLLVVPMEHLPGVDV